MEAQGQAHKKKIKNRDLPWTSLWLLCEYLVLQVCLVDCPCTRLRTAVRMSFSCREECLAFVSGLDFQLGLARCPRTSQCCLSYSNSLQESPHPSLMCDKPAFLAWTILCRSVWHCLRAWVCLRTLSACAFTSSAQCQWQTSSVQARSRCDMHAGSLRLLCAYAFTRDQRNTCDRQRACEPEVGWVCMAGCFRLLCAYVFTRAQRDACDRRAACEPEVGGMCKKLCLRALWACACMSSVHCLWQMSSVRDAGEAT